MSAPSGVDRIYMKKTFPLHAEGKQPARVLDAIRHELHKYVKRERRRALPEGADFWDFACKFGTQADNAEVAHLNELGTRLDTAAQAGATHVYVEILAVPGVRQPRAASADAAVTGGSEPGQE
jgi:hypothetical protein